MEKFITDINGAEFSAVCEQQQRRGGFRHVVTVYKNGEQITKKATNYTNRTWERFPFALTLSRACEQIGGATGDALRLAWHL